jgi:uncharacterized GH25 family protein
VKLLLAATLAAAPVLGLAHDLWVEPAAVGFVVRDGWRGDRRFPLDASKVKAIRCGDAKGVVRDLARTARAAPEELRFPGPCSVVSVFQDLGTWSLTPDGEVNLPRTRVKDAVKAWTSRRWAKWVDVRDGRAGAGAGAVLGDELELVPVTDLARARPGDAVTLRVLAAGRPVGDVALDVADRPLGVTDARGELRVLLPEAGVLTIAASLRVPRATPEADADALEATLTFEVGR